jgi:hypothetical protein
MMFVERLVTRLLEACVLRGLQRPEAPAEAVEALLVYSGVVHPSPEVFDRLLVEYLAAAGVEPADAWRPTEPARPFVATAPTADVDHSRRTSLI